MQVHYFLVPPPEADFLSPLEARLQALPQAFRHPDPRDRSWVVAADAGMARWLEAKLRMEPRTPLDTQGLLTLHPAAVEVYQDAPAEILRVLEPLVSWLLATWPCRVLSEEGEDWTARYASDPRALFVEEDCWA